MTCNGFRMVQSTRNFANNDTRRNGQLNRKNGLLKTRQQPCEDLPFGPLLEHTKTLIS